MFVSIHGIGVRGLAVFRRNIARCQTDNTGNRYRKIIRHNNQPNRYNKKTIHHSLQTTMLKGNAIIGQSGGPTAVINASLCGLIQESQKQTTIEKVLGMCFGIEGFMQDEVIDLGNEPPETIEQLKFTPSSALGSCRHKLQETEFPKVLEQLKKYNVRYYFLIGGNDTMDTIHRVERYCREQGYELHGVGIPKTVDNDLFATDHTPGFASAGRYVALSVKQAGMLARDMKRVDQFVVFQTVGRSAGWLSAAAACAKQNPDDAPHLILIPERPFIKERFLAETKTAYEQFGWVSIVCGEGVCGTDGKPISESQTADKFSNIEFGAMGGSSAALVLHRILSDTLGWRGEFQVCESLQMCAADRAVPLDIEEAYACGREAVRLAVNGTSGVMVTIQRTSNIPYAWSTGTAPLSEVALGEKPMPDEFICPDHYFVTEKCLEYLRPLLGKLPDYARLNKK
jgi:6-phosphofructokinase 1